MNNYKVPFRETENEVITAIIQWFKFESNDLFVDVGCGNGIVLEQIAKQTKIDCLGIEIDPVYYNEALQRLKSFESVKLIRDDLRTCNMLVRDQRCIYYLAWTKQYIDEFDFASMVKPGDYIFVFKHQIPNMNSFDVLITSPYNNVYVYKIE
jgi:hypothetical protein